jgi:crotonobetainyl-CoA:carnitine CoA-transferase CaiB-like acyl-CoA transferase
MWVDLCNVLCVPELVADPRFKAPGQRLTNRVALWEILEQRFKSASSASWMEQLRGASIPCGPVNTLDMALEAEQIRHRKMVMQMRSAAGSTVRVPGNPIKFGVDPVQLPVIYPPHLGQDTDAVLRALLEMEPQRLQVLKNQGVLRQFEPGQPTGAASGH